MSILPSELAPTAAETTAENPWPLRYFNKKLKGYVDSMSPMWVLAQIIKVQRRGTAGLTYITLRDIDTDASFNAYIRPQFLTNLPIQPSEGTQAVIHCKPVLWEKSGSMMLEIADIRPVGEGALLAQLEKLKQELRAEGLFDASHKKPLPFLPTKIGLICGRNSDAERDVIENAKRNWPAAQFEVREVAVQGVRAVSEVTAALLELDEILEVEVIIIARGGGSLEDLLPFSDESLVRAVFAAKTPVISAIGHEPDTPILDFVADVRASTPTDAGKIVAPNLAEELQSLLLEKQRARAVITRLISQHSEALANLKSRPVLAQPHTMLEVHAKELRAEIVSARTTISYLLSRDTDRIQHLAKQAQSLSPLHTLKRGYAVVQNEAGKSLLEPSQAPAGTKLNIRLAGGRIHAISEKN